MQIGGFSADQVVTVLITFVILGACFMAVKKRAKKKKEQAQQGPPQV